MKVTNTSYVIRLIWNTIFANTQKRYEARHKLLSGIASKLGFRLYNKNLAWLNDKEFWRVWSEFPAAKNYIPDRKFNIYGIACSIRKVSGDMAECGVYTGGTSHLMLSATEGTNKHLYGFDSFEGLSEPFDLDKPAEKRTFNWKQHDLATGKEIAQKNLSQHEGRFTLLKGWIPEGFEKIREKYFSLVHIDVDLYAPTLAALDFFYPRMNPGGIIVCDDYGFESCPGARSAMDETAKNENNYVIHLTTGQGVFIKR